jgi:hypothetical protein
MRGADVVRKIHPSVIALSAVGLVLVVLAACFVLIVRPHFVEARPTLMYFRLET